MDKKNLTKDLNERELFDLKNRLLDTTCFDAERISLWSFLEYIFYRKHYEDMPFEERGCSEYVSWLHNEPYQAKQPFIYNALLLGINGQKGTHHVVLNDVEIQAFISRNPFVIMSPISYVGNSRNAKNARYLFAFAFDLDGVGVVQLHDLEHQVKQGILPCPNIIVNSGHGLHLYYILQKPIALFSDAVEILQRLKHGLTDIIWNLFTSSNKTKQFQGIYQGFRVPTSKTKFDTIVTAFATSCKKLWTCKELNEFINDPKDKINEADTDRLDKGIFKPDRLTKKRAAELYPEWYEKVIVRGDKSRKTWTVNKGLYNWWLDILCNQREKVKTGHRYFCLLALAAFGIKCKVNEEEVKNDMFSLVDSFDELTKEETNHFTMKDAQDAFQAYKENYCTFPRHTIERLTDIRIDTNRRNGQTQRNHLEIARAIRDIKIKQQGKITWRNTEGRPKATAENSPQCKAIQEWKRSHPENDNKSQCARDLKLSRPTVIKWWATCGD